MWGRIEEGGANSLRKLREPLRDRRENPLQISHHLRVPEAKHEEALPSKEAVPDAVAFATHVLATIYFDHNPRIEAQEIGDVAAEGNLTAKSRPEVVAAKVAPQAQFSRC